MIKAMRAASQCFNWPMLYRGSHRQAKEIVRKYLFFNHRGTENTEGLNAPSLANLGAISDDFIKPQSFHIKDGVRGIRNG